MNDINSQFVRCKTCGTAQEIRSEIEIKDYQCPSCWHEHRTKVKKQKGGLK